jgi:small-conductance mechanosensitive channel
MEAFLPDPVKIVLLGLIAVAILLGWAARTFPEMEWLRVFRLPTVQLSEEEKARRRRTANRLAAFEMMLAGLVLPLLYVFSTVMMFNEFKTVPTILVAVASLACFGIGITVLVRGR